MNQDDSSTRLASAVERELTLLDYLAILRRRWLIASAVFGAVMALVVGYYVLKAPRYEASATVLVHTSTSQGLFARPPGNSSSLYRTTATEIEFARSEALASIVGDMPPETAIRVEQSPEDRSETLIFVVEGPDQVTVSELVERWAQSYVEVRESQVASDVASTLAGLDLSIAELTNQRDVLLEPINPIEEALSRETDPDVISRLTTQRLILLQSLNNDLAPIQGQLSVLNVDRSRLAVLANYLGENDETGARVLGSDNEGRLTGPLLVRSLALGLVVASLLAIAISLLVEGLRDRINDAGDLERALPGVTVLARLPDMGQSLERPITWASIQDLPQYRASLDSLITSLSFLSLSNPIGSLAVVAASANSGKSTVTVSLALAAQAAGMSTVVVEGDLHRPDLERYLGIDPGVGLSDLIGSDVEVDTILRSVPKSGGLRLLGPGLGDGQHSPGDVWRDVVRDDLVARLTGIAEFVVFDSPPLLSVADGLVIGSSTEVVLLVVRLRHSSTREVVEAASRLTWAGVTLAGCVLIGGETESYYGAE